MFRSFRKFLIYLLVSLLGFQPLASNALSYVSPCPLKNMSHSIENSKSNDASKDVDFSSSMKCDKCLKQTCSFCIPIAYVISMDFSVPQSALNTKPYFVKSLFSSLVLETAQKPPQI